MGHTASSEGKLEVISNLSKLGHCLVLCIPSVVGIGCLAWTTIYNNNGDPVGMQCAQSHYMASNIPHRVMPYRAKVAIPSTDMYQSEWAPIVYTV